MSEVAVQDSVVETTVVKTEINCEHGCFTIVEDETVINACCDNLHTIQVGHDWIDVTPSERHGEVIERTVHDKDDAVQCVVVRPDSETGHDTVCLEYCNLSILPDSDQSHELYSVCISKDVRQCLILDVEDESRWEKVIYFADRSDWTEPQVMALVLLMHAKLAPNALAIVSMNEEVEAAEKMAEAYCRTMGVHRSELSALHTTGSPTRISRVDVERVKRKEPDNTSFSTARNVHAGIVRMDSQTPLRPINQVVIIESGGIHNSHIVDREFNIKPLTNKLETTDFHTDPADVSETKKSKKKSKKSKSKKSKKSKNKDKETDTSRSLDEGGVEVAVETTTAEDRISRFITPSKPAPAVM